MHEATLKDLELPAAPRAAPDDRRHARGRRHLPRAAHDPRAARASGEDLAAVSPDAWLLNYTNPMAILCQAYAEGSPHKQIVGLCHSVQNTTRELAELCGVPFAEVAFAGAGVNHQAFILRFERDGEDLYPRLDAAIEADPELRRRVRVELYRRFGFYPTESSEHGAEYVPVVPARRRLRRALPARAERVHPAQRGEPARSTTTSAARSRAARRCRWSAATSTRPRSCTRWSPARSA